MTKGIELLGSIVPEAGTDRLMIFRLEMGTIVAGRMEVIEERPLKVSELISRFYPKDSK